MKSSKAKSPAVLPGDGLVPLNAILCTEELHRRPARAPDYETENRALVALTQALADSPRTILQTLAETLLEVFKADSAGISLLTKDEQRFFWPAIAGRWKPHIGNGTPRDFGPCGDVLDHNASLLFRHWEQRYPYLLAATPPVEEALLVPFYIAGKVAGTIWTIAHDKRRQFDAEDLRQLENLARFTAAAYQAMELERTQNSRRAALNLMEDAVEARQALERLNGELRASERRFREMINALPAAVYTTDAEGRLTHFNPAAVELAGRMPELGTDRWCVSWKLYHADGTPMPHDKYPMAVVLKENRAFRGEEAILERPDGTRIWFVPYPTPLREPGGRLIGGINMLVDITERKRMERQVQAQADELATADRRKDEFLAMLSHELRNPLAPIVNAVQLIGQEKNESALHHEARGVIERQTQHLSRLVEDLLDVSRLTTGYIRLRTEQVDVNAIIEQAVERVRPLISRRGQQLSVSPADGCVGLEADPTRLGQIVGNLLDNASKYSDDGGHIMLSVERGDGEAIIRVRDDGEGMAADTLLHGFELFTQADKSADRAQGGLGIGLALVKNLVELHHGTIEAHSEGLGQGSEFIVRLPLAAQAQPATAPARAPDTAAGGKACLRVLVVDDNADAAKMLSMLLRSWSHEVCVACDGSSALQKVEEFRPHVILLDIGLPGMDGCEVARLIRHDLRLKDVRIVAITGYGQSPDRQRSKEAGFDHHLVKPVEPSDLQALLTGFLPPTT